MKRLFVAGALMMQLFSTANAQQKTNPAEISDKMQWFADAKLGIFIHYGIYAVNGIDESWSFHNKKISHADYMQQLKGLTAKQFDAEAWADLIAASGAQYAVLTTKHHDGVALWDTKFSKLSTVKSTPAKKDIVTPFFNALRKRNIKTGAYFSLLDWTYNDYPGFLKDSSRYQIKDQPARWKKFQSFLNGQLTELSTQFNPDLWWFDGDWEHSADEWDAQGIRKLLTSRNPNTIINGRLQGYGDYDTPEQNFPVVRPAFHWWELCMTINNNWGYQPQDTNWKTPYEVITIFADAISNGGNMLLDIGPKEDGTIPAEEVNVLKELGKWNKKHSEAIFGTIGGIPQGHFYGPTTLSKDSSTLYLFIAGNTTGRVMIKGLDNKIKNISVVGKGTPLQHKVVGKISWSPVPGLVYIDVPANVQDEYMTVLKVELDKPVKLYRGKGGLNG
ncbi:alpha-L-fucosidase [Chitinophaga skermanii]|uniref:alpha-L-fucosidase n=1 Tax=Chitinophaga skermanii TaxID=331697 RepID=A0A327QEZ0_9BACT|nr:alpha-L-fucosidase [Chitinophaga skermanii]RAJ02565.1 alpha-L-fucosidase [Chitinophaga skermanii]